MQVTNKRNQTQRGDSAFPPPAAPVGNMFSVHFHNMGPEHTVSSGIKAMKRFIPGFTEHMTSRFNRAQPTSNRSQPASPTPNPIDSKPFPKKPAPHLSHRIRRFQHLNNPKCNNKLPLRQNTATNLGDQLPGLLSQCPRTMPCSFSEIGS